MSSSITPNTPFNQNVQSLTKTSDKADKSPVGQQVAELAQEKSVEKAQEPVSLTHKQQLNASIIESSLKFNSTIGSQPLSLVLKTALQGINEALQEMGIDTSVEDAYESGIDFSPEATAERIVSFSTQFLSSYREQHPEMNEEESLSSFVNIISGGIDQGFGEARDILSALSVLEGEIGDNIDKTYTLVQEGLQSFVDSFSTSKEDEAEL